MKTTNYTNENMDRLSSRKDPLGKSETYTYDDNGNLLTFKDRKLQTTTYIYDPLNRRTKATYADTSNTTYTYDKGNRLTQIVDSTSGTLTRTYDGLDRLTSETTPQGAVAYTYDSAGRRATMTVSGQPTTNYFYDDANRLTQITQGLSTVAFIYDDAGRRTSLTLPNGVVVEYSYDPASRLKELKYKNGAVDLGNLTYFYDKAGNRTKVGGSFARTGLPQAVASATYDNANRQTVFGGKTMVFDLNGNLTSITESGSTTVHTWNARNQLTAMSGPGVSASFVYDGLGRREKKTINGSLTEFLYDGFNPVQETSGATVLANTLTGLGVDELFSRTDMGAATTSHFLSDALGSVVALADPTGIIQTEYTYESFGKTTATGAIDTNPLQYTGRENDGTGLYNYRARYYQPGLQRFISEDSVEFAGGSNNLYHYTGNNPTNFVDPSGEFVWIPVIVGGVGAVAGGIVEGYQAYKCYGFGTDFTKAVGRGVLAGGLGALAGLGVGVINPYLGGAFGAAVYNGVNYELGAQVTPAQALVDVVFAGATAGLATKFLSPVQGGWNFNPLKSPRTFGPQAVRLYELEGLGHASDLLLKNELPDLSGRGNCGCQ